MRSWIRFGISNCILLNNYCFDWNRLNWAFFILNSHKYVLLLIFPFFLLLLFRFVHSCVGNFGKSTFGILSYFIEIMLSCIVVISVVIIKMTINHKIQFHSRSESLFYAWKRIYFEIISIVVKILENNLIDCLEPQWMRMWFNGSKSGKQSQKSIFVHW